MHDDIIRQFREPSGKIYDVATLTPYCKMAFDAVRQELPEMIGKRLSSSRKMSPHGDHNDMFLFDVWDKNQTDVIHRHHFKYCLNYRHKRPNGQPEDGQLHLWLNKIRIYKNRSDIIAHLDNGLRERVPVPFEYAPHDRAFNVSHMFYFPKDLDLLVGYLVPLYQALIMSVHTLLMEVIDQMAGPMEKEELRRVIAERERIPYKHTGVHDPERVREYTRSIPPRMRMRLLKQANYRCVLCDADLRTSGHHIDHIVPFSKGGKTVEENLRATCPACNLKKGNR